MKTKQQIERKIKKLKEEEYAHQMNGGGGFQCPPSPYIPQIKLLEWVLKEK